MAEKDNKEPVADHRPSGPPPELDAGYDSYRSLADGSIVIFVPRHAVPPFRFKAGGWQVLYPSVELSSEAKARIAEQGYWIEAETPKGSSEIVASRQSETVPSLEVEFALVIARMIDSVGQNPKDMRNAIYDLARYKLQEQLLHAKIDEREHAHRAMEVAIRGVETFSEKHAQALPPVQQAYLSPAETSITRNLAPAPTPQLGQHLRLPLESNANPLAHKSTPWSYLLRATAIMAIVVATLIAAQYRDRLLSWAFNRTLPTHQVATEGPSSPPLASAAPPQEPASPLPTDYGVYAIDGNTLIGLDRIAVTTVLTTPGRTVLSNGHPKFIIFSRNLAAAVGDRVDARILAKVAREFSANAAGKKPAEDAWIIRNIPFAFRSSPVKGNPEMVELHSDDPALELTAGRYALLLKMQAFDFSVEGEVVDPRHCVERIVGSVGIVYSSCKNP